MSLDEQIADRLTSRTFEQWADQAAATGHCSNPVRLVGQSATFDAQTGHEVGRYSSSEEPDGVTYVRCGNRRAARCPSCSDEYKQDMWHLVHSGAAGGSKGVPDAVATHPLVFVTLTAPSFGAVHARRERHSRVLPCRPRSGRSLCEHGRPLWCMTRHDIDDALVGEPLCADCYDYAGHVVWQWHAPELWRRYVIRIRREIAKALGVSERQAHGLARLQYAKVAEFQRRGAVHFHALLRLDGDATPTDPFPMPSVSVDSTWLATIAGRAAKAVEVVAPPTTSGGRARLLRWGAQCDARAVRRRVDDGGELTERAVAAYIAKYATKAAEDLTTPTSRRMSVHVKTLQTTVEQLGGSSVDKTYALLARWSHMLGFRGHFSTKSRRYSTTLGALRAARRRWQRRSHRPEGCEEQVAEPEVEDSTLVVGQWSFAGMGWLTAGDAALAAEAAAAAREWRGRRSTSNQDRNARARR